MSVWHELLTALDRCDLRSSARKTIICPSSATVLSWLGWAGILSVSPHVCTDNGCHVCKFVSEKQQSVVVSATANRSKVPDAGSLYTSRAVWLAPVWLSAVICEGLKIS